MHTRYFTNMEGDNGDHNMGSGSSRGGAPPTSSRWNPTTEQINMLEGLYMQGIRTPSAEQIKQITSRLQAFGHIEGKNVFYWFQNHKARQRQKQKQENMAYINSFIHRTTQPIFPAVPSHHHPYPNVCGPYYLPVRSQADHHHAGTLTFHQQYHPNDKVPLSNGIRRRSPIRLEKLETITGTISCSVSTGPYEPSQEGYYHNNNSANKPMMSNLSCNQETLPLFPLSPTGLLKAAGSNEGRSSDGICSAYDAENNPSTSNGPTPPNSSGVVEEGRCSSAGHDQPFYDFLSR